MASWTAAVDRRIVRDKIDIRRQVCTDRKCQNMSLSKLLHACTYEDLLFVQRELDECFFALGKGKYSAGKIYRIIQKDKFVLIYVGSTIREIDVRFGGHCSFIKACPFSILILTILK